MTMRLFVGDAAADASQASRLAEGRAFAYGDGVFETMRAVGGAIPWWPAHRARLRAGATRLGIALPSDAVLDREVADFARTRQARLFTGYPLARFAQCQAQRALGAMDRELTPC